MFVPQVIKSNALDRLLAGTLGEKILVVDDDPEILALFNVALKRARYDVMCASEAYSGLAKFQEFRPDIVIVDYEMPFLSGIEVARKILEMKGETRVIMVSAREEIRGEALNMGIEFLLKPLSLKVILGTVQAKREEIVLFR